MNFGELSPLLSGPKAGAASPQWSAVRVRLSSVVRRQGPPLLSGPPQGPPLLSGPPAGPLSPQWSAGRDRLSSVVRPQGPSLLSGPPQGPPLLSGPPAGTLSPQWSAGRGPSPLSGPGTGRRSRSPGSVVTVCSPGTVPNGWWRGAPRSWRTERRAAAAGGTAPPSGYGPGT